MRSSACDTLSRSCARRVLCWPAFPLVPALRSTGSAARCPPSSPASSLLSRGLTSRARASPASAPRLPGAGRGGLPPTVRHEISGSRSWSVRTCQGLRPRRVRWALAMTLPPCCLPLGQRRRHPELVTFRGSMGGPHDPLPTLRLHPRGCRRTARGRCGSLLLHRDGLPPSLLAGLPAHCPSYHGVLQA